MSSHRKLDKDAVRAAREFLLGRSGRSSRAPGGRADPSGEPARNRDAPGSPGPAAPARSDAAPPHEPPRLELSAPGIRRAAAGWRARCIHTRGVDSRHVLDGRYGGYVGSFIQALEVRDRFHRERGVPIPWEAVALVDGERVAPEVARKNRSLVVRWQGQEHEVTGDDAEEIATEIALDLFVEFLDAFRPDRADEQPSPAGG